MFKRSIRELKNSDIVIFF